MAEVKIGNVKVGDDHPVVFMAELGTFFNKDVDMARDFIDRSLEAGADIIKTEILHTPDVCQKSAGLTHTYNHADGQKTENYWELLKRKSVSLEDYRKIFDHCHKTGLPIVASVYDFEGVDFLVENKAAGIKLWRNNFNNYPLIKYAAKTGLPIIFDFFLVTEDEAQNAVQLALDNGAGGVIVNHHPGSNPAPAEVHNLRMIDSYKKLLDVPVGLSCHYKGDEMLYAAIGAGVNILEKGVHTNPEEADQNVISTAAFDDLKQIILKCKECSAALGSSWRKFDERDETLQYGLVARTDIKLGDELDMGNVRFCFPAKGIHVKHWEDVEGRKAAKPVARGNEITYDDIDA